ncbi:MAG: hypothetical protein AAGH41_12800 [Pseudomonadota bacterium]
MSFSDVAVFLAASAFGLTASYFSVGAIVAWSADRSARQGSAAQRAIHRLGTLALLALVVILIIPFIVACIVLRFWGTSEDYPHAAAVSLLATPVVGLIGTVLRRRKDWTTLMLRNATEW